VIAYLPVKRSIKLEIPAPDEQQEETTVEEENWRLQV